jgi:hypothetical protein
MIRNWLLVVPAMGRARLTPRSLGLTLGKTTGERGGLAPGRTLRGFQVLDQPLDFLFQPLALFLQPLLVSFQPRLVPLQLFVPPMGLVALLPRAAQLLPQFPDAVERIEGFEKQIILLEGPILLGFIPVNKYLIC